MSVCPNILAMDSNDTLFAIASDANVCLAIWNRTHKAAVGKQVTIKRNPFEMSGFSLFCQMSETQRSAEYCTISVTKPLAVSYRSKDR